MIVTALLPHLNKSLGKESFLQIGATFFKKGQGLHGIRIINFQNCFESSIFTELLELLTKSLLSKFSYCYVDYLNTEHLVHDGIVFIPEDTRKNMEEGKSGRTIQLDE